jgi:hypothetical protein
MSAKAANRNPHRAGIRKGVRLRVAVPVACTDVTEITACQVVCETWQSVSCFNEDAGAGAVTGSTASSLAHGVKETPQKDIPYVTPSEVVITHF